MSPARTLTLALFHASQLQSTWPLHSHSHFKVPEEEREELVDVHLVDDIDVDPGNQRGARVVRMTKIILHGYRTLHPFPLYRTQVCRRSPACPLLPVYMLHQSTSSFHTQPFSFQSPFRVRGSYRGRGGPVTRCPPRSRHTEGNKWSRPYDENHLAWIPDTPPVPRLPYIGTPTVTSMSPAKTPDLDIHPLTPSPASQTKILLSQGLKLYN